MAASWDDYRVAVAVAEAGTLAGAARALGVAQPTVGRRLEGLEADLGALLFERRPGGLTPTALGRRILAIAEEMRGRAQAIEEAAQEARAGGRTPVRVATTRGLATAWLVPALARLRAARPDVAVAVEVGLGAADLAGHEADIALRMGRTGRPEELGRLVGSVHCGLYASQAYLRRHGAPQSLGEIARHAVIGSTGELVGLAQVRRLAEHASGATPAFAASDVAVQITALREGQGLLAAPCLMAEREGAVRVLREAFDVALDLRLLVNRRLRAVEPYGAVYDFLVDACLADRAVFEGRAALNDSEDPSAETRMSVRLVRP